LAGIQIGKEFVSAGTKKVVFFNICKMADGEDLRLTAHVVAGVKDGPTLALLAGTHGNSNFNIDVVKTIIEQTDPKNLKGNILGVPMMNPPGFEAGTRNTPVIFNDNLNMNRVFPGKKDGRITEKLAYTVTEELIKKSDCIIDFHGGEKETYINYTFVDTQPGEFGEKLLDFSKAFGDEILYLGPFFNGSATAVAENSGKIGIVSEIGHEWYDAEKLQKRGTTGVRNIMKKLGMIEGEPELPPRQYIVKERTLLLSANGGMFYPTKGIDHTKLVGKTFDGGTVLAKVVNPYTFQVLEEIRAPYDKSVIIWNRIGRSMINPGGYTYVIGNAKTIQWIRGSPSSA
jgi:predicted deacylase